MILLLAATALAGPDRVATSIPVGTTVTDIAVSTDGTWIGWNDAGTGTLTVLDAGTFTSTVVAACSRATGVAVAGIGAEGVTFFTGCEDGSVVAFDVSPIGVVTEREAPFAMGGGPVSAVETDGVTLYAVLDDPEDGAVVAAMTIEGAEPVTSFPMQLSSDTVEDTVLVDDYLIVAHGADEVSKIVLSTSSSLYPESSLGGRALVDAYPSANGSEVYLADENGGLVRFEVGDNDYVSSLVGIADTITAVGIDATDGWMVLGAGDDALLYSFDGVPGELVETIEGAANLTELVTIEGYAFGTTSDGAVLVLTDRPWVSVQPLSPLQAEVGAEVSVSFSSDIAGDYEVRVGGSVQEPGPIVATGEVDALTSTSATFLVDAADEYVEGANTIWVFVTDSASGLTGRAGGVLTVDNPPEQVALGASGIGFGNESISVAFTALAAADIASYTIYIDVAPFTAADYPEGGPSFGGTDDITAPVVITAEPEAPVSSTIYPLTNGTTYYVAVRAVDDGGLEGPMSDILEATPEQTYCASCLAGDGGGFLPGICGVGPGAGAAAILLAGAAVLRRRRRVVGGAALLALALIAPPAEANEDDDEGPRTMNVQVRFGPTTIVDPYVQQIFGERSNEMLWFEYGYASRFIDANLGIGFYQEKGFLQTASGATSSEADKFTIVPLALTLTGRLDFFDEQPIVPFGRVGLDYWMWEENWFVVTPDTTDHISNGGKYGWHFGGGLMILLDVFDRRAASRLEAISGINDTFVVAEYRNTRLKHGTDELNLSSSELTFGLKFDF